MCAAPVQCAGARANRIHSTRSLTHTVAPLRTHSHVGVAAIQCAQTDCQLYYVRWGGCAGAGVLTTDVVVVVVVAGRQM